VNRIGYTERKAVYAAALKKYGAEAQVAKFYEELGEFLTEFGRLLGGADNKDNVAEELADLTIMLEQLRQICDINEEVCDHMDYKIVRLRGRISMPDDSETKGEN
jgi:NTP pyrophosphatase (non-canonical NTP hydrolase)